jgi:hypothetical protein
LLIKLILDNPTRLGKLLSVPFGFFSPLLLVDVDLLSFKLALLSLDFCLRCLHLLLKTPVISLVLASLLSGLKLKTRLSIFLFEQLLSIILKHVPFNLLLKVPLQEG